MGHVDTHGFANNVSDPWVLAPGEGVTPLGAGSHSVNGNVMHLCLATL